MQSIPSHSPKRVLEVGCGMGAFTKEILKALNDGDTFHIVELNSEFCEAIEMSLLHQFRTENPNIEVTLHNSPIEESNLQGEFDAIICGLPFNNFPVKLVQQLFTVMFGFLRPGSELAYFEYFGMRNLKRWFGLPKVRRETIQRTRDIKALYEKHQGTQKNVLRNMPSCRVVRLKK